MQRITKNIQLFTDKPRKIVVDPKTLKVEQDAHGKPMVLLMAWLLSQPKHIRKFAQIYVDQGFDCLVTRASPWQLMWPTKGTQVNYLILPILLKVFLMKFSIVYFSLLLLMS